MIRHWSQFVPDKKVMSTDIRGHEALHHRHHRAGYEPVHRRHQNDSCIRMGNDESHFNVSLNVRDKVTRQCPQTTTFEDKGEPKRIRTEVLLLTSLTPYR